MQPQELITYATTDKYKAICRRLSPNLAEDLHQEFLLILLEYDKSKLRQVRQPDAFLSQILKSLTSKKNRHTPFYKTYWRNPPVNELQQELKFIALNGNGHDKKFQHAFNSLYWYDKKLLEIYCKEGSCRKIGEKLNIHYKSIEISIAKARKQITARMEKYPIKVLLPVQYNVTGLDYHRLLMPFERLQKTHGSVYDIKMLRGVVQDNTVYEPPLESMTDEQLKEFNIIYVLRQLSHDINKVQPLIDRIKKLGLKMVFDIDDYWNLPKEHYWYGKYHSQRVPENTVMTIKAADAVTTTTATFAKFISEYNSSVTILPNCVSPDDLQFKPRTITSPRIRFGWIGGVFHKADIATLTDSIKKLWASPELSGKWQLSLGGFNPNQEYKDIEKIMTDKFCFRGYDSTYQDYLMQYTPSMEHISFDKPYRRLWGRDVRSYGELYNSVDVCLVPLVKNDFNECKSELKIVEAGTMKKAVICSDVKPYNQWIQHGVNGFLVKPERNFIDWFTCMRKLILQPELITQMGEALYKTIQENFNIDEHNKKRDYLLQNLI